MAFDPDKYLAEKLNSSPGSSSEASVPFDPDKYLSEKSGNTSDQSPSLLDQAQKFGQTAGKSIITLGMPNVAYSGGEALSDFLSDKGTQLLERLKGIPESDVQQVHPFEHYKQGYLDALKKGREEQAAYHKESPVLSRIAEMSGAVLPGLATGGAPGFGEALASGGLKELAPAVAESALQSTAYGGAQMLAQHPRSLLEGPEAQQQISSDVLKSLPLLAAAGPVLQGGTEALGGVASSLLSKEAPEAAGAISGAAEAEAPTNSPILAQLKQAFNIGKSGEPIGGSAGLEAQVAKKKSLVDSVVDFFNSKEKDMLNQKADLLNTATENGTIVSPSSELGQFKGSLEVNGPKELGGKAFQNVLDSLNEYKRSGLNPKDAEALRTDLGSLLQKAQNPDVRDSLINLRNELQSGLNKTVDGYEGLNGQISQFLKAGKQKFFPGRQIPNSKDAQAAQLGNKVEGLLENLRSNSPGAEGAQKTVQSLQEGLAGFQAANPEAAERLGIDPQGFINSLKQKSDQIVAAQKLKGYSPTATPNLLGVKLPAESTAQAAALQAGRAVGYAIKSGNKLSSLLQSLPGETEAHKTAALFSLLQQNPQIRQQMDFSDKNGNTGNNE